MPCSDTETSDKNSLLEITADTGIDHDHNASDLCSPFCQCHCCHVHTLNNIATTFEPLNPEISSEVYLHFDSLGEEVTSTLLHPPRA